MRTGRTRSAAGSPPGLLHKKVYGAKLAAVNRFRLRRKPAEAGLAVVPLPTGGTRLGDCASTVAPNP